MPRVLISFLTEIQADSITFLSLLLLNPVQFKDLVSTSISIVSPPLWLPEPWSEVQVTSPRERLDGLLLNPSFQLCTRNEREGGIFLRSRTVITALLHASSQTLDPLSATTNGGSGGGTSLCGLKDLAVTAVSIQH